MDEIVREDGFYWVFDPGYSEDPQVAHWDGKAWTHTGWECWSDGDEQIQVLSEKLQPPSVILKE